MKLGTRGLRFSFYHTHYWTFYVSSLPNDRFNVSLKHIEIHITLFRLKTNMLTYAKLRLDKY